MKEQIKTIGMVIAGISILCACTNEEDHNAENEPVDLRIRTSVAATEVRSAVEGTSFATDSLIAVYANNTTTNSSTNNYAIYKNTSGGWAFNGTDKIKLSAEDATIFAHYPADGGYVITHNAAVTASSTLTIGLFEGNTSENDNNKIFVASSNTKNINVAKGEVDFMYSAEEGGGHPTANNGKKSGGSATDHIVDLIMRHAMAMVSFRVYNDNTYTNTGSLTKIQLKNKDANTMLNKGTGATMQLGDGTITAAAAFTRFIYTGTSSSSTAGFTLEKFDNTDGAKDQTPAFSMLVYPENTEDKSTINAIFTVDGTEYPVALPASGQAWAKGKNYIYTVKLNGKDLGVGNVSIVDWVAQEISSELQPVK